MKFFKAVLKEVKDPMSYAYGLGCNTRIEDRIEKNGKCPECGKDKWFFLPKESSSVRTGGKPYIECLGCGYTSHL